MVWPTPDRLSDDKELDNVVRSVVAPNVKKDGGESWYGSRYFCYNQEELGVEAGGASRCSATLIFGVGIIIVAIHLSAWYQYVLLVPPVSLITIIVETLEIRCRMREHPFHCSNWPELTYSDMGSLLRQDEISKIYSIYGVMSGPIVGTVGSTGAVQVYMYE